VRAVVLAGGLGVRLREVVADVPKPMAPIAGRPFLELLLDALAAGGVEHVVLSIGHLADVIEDHFGEHYAGMAISCVREARILGTGGAARLALDACPAGEPVFVLNGDTFVDVDYRALMAAHVGGAEGNSLTVVLRELNDASRYGSVRIEGDRLIAFDSAGHAGPGLVNAGVYVMDPGLLATLPRDVPVSLEADFLEPLAPALAARVWIVRSFFIDIGIPQDYERAQLALPEFLASRSAPPA
jgi:D-glycero-alpha-D-manno-heptose 1-phosphate guanylyltransferase